MTAAVCLRRFPAVSARPRPCNFVRCAPQHLRPLLVLLNPSPTQLREAQLPVTCVPNVDNLRFECFESVHAQPYMGHYGVRRTQDKALQLYYWPGLQKDVKHFIDECDSCERVKHVRHKPLGLLQPLQIPGRRWESVSMDFITDLPVTPNGNDSIWVVVDRLSKLVHLEPCKKTITAAQTAKLYERAVFRHHGLPDNIVSDRDVRFVSEFWRAINKRFRTELHMSTKNHPQTDGQTENANLILEDTLRHFVGPFQQDWEDLLPVVEFAMNNAYNSTTKTTAFMLTYGQHPNDPTTLWMRHRNQAVNAFVGRWSEQLARAKTNIAVAQERQKYYADLKRQPAPQWKPGTEVLLSTKLFKLPDTQCRKLSPRWVGPFRVVKAVGNLAYKLELPPALNRMHPVFHVSALRKYKRSVHATPPPLPVFVDGEMEFEVDYIKDTREKGSKRQYRVCWLGDPDQDTWEPVRNLMQCQDKIAQYWASKNVPMPDDALFVAKPRNRVNHKALLMIRCKAMLRQPSF